MSTGQSNSMPEMDARTASCGALPPGMTMADLFRGAASRHPHRPALYADGVRLDFAELDRRTDRVAEALRTRGYGRESLIGVMLPDGVAMVEMLIATAKLGASLLALNWRLSAAEIAYIVGDAEPELIVVSHSFGHLLADVPASLPRLNVPVSAEGLEAALAVTPEGKALPTEYPVQPLDRWFMLYTSGTTGRPKGCQHTQLGCYVGTLSLSAWLGLRDTDRQLCNLPLFHVAGLHMFLGHHIAGACVVIPPSQLDGEELLRLVSDEGITMQNMPVLTVEAYIEAQERLRLPLRLRIIVGGGLKPTTERMRRIEAVLGGEVVQGYGQSEIFGYGAFGRFADAPERSGTVGKAFPHLRARIVDDQDHDLPSGTTGELLLRGGSVMIGYFRRPEANASSFVDGWLRTGDLFRQDDEGYLYFVGRSKELIKSGGENVYPAEVEEVLKEHPAVADCCVIGVPDDTYGEAVKAMIVLRPGSQPTPQDIADFCRGKIAGYKRPRYVQFTQNILRNYQGKAQRAEMAKLPILDNQIAYRSPPRG